MAGPRTVPPANIPENTLYTIYITYNVYTVSFICYLNKTFYYI